MVMMMVVGWAPFSEWKRERKIALIIVILQTIPRTVVRQFETTLRSYSFTIEDLQPAVSGLFHLGRPSFACDSFMFSIE